MEQSEVMEIGKEKFSKERRDIMITAELTQKIDALSNDEYHMVEIYVNNVLEYSRRRKKKWHGRRFRLT